MAMIVDLYPIEIKWFKGDRDELSTAPEDATWLGRRAARGDFRSTMPRASATGAHLIAFDAAAAMSALTRRQIR